MSDPRIGTDAAEVLPGSFGADLIIGLGGDDRIDGNAGSDTLSGNAGVDTVLGGLDNDYVIGGRDNDILRGDGGNDTIFGNKGNDAIEGGIGDDVIFGGKDNDVIDAGSGNDVIWGDLGADSLIGGTGADVFVLTRTSGGETLAEADTIVDFTPGLDRIGLADNIDLASLNVTLQPIGNSTSTVNVIIQDLVSGQILAKLDRINRNEFRNNDIFTEVLRTSQDVDIEEIPPSTPDPTTTPDTPTPNTVTRETVGPSAPITANSTVVTFENVNYTFSASDFSFFDADGDSFSSVRIASVPDRGDLVQTTSETNATTGATTTTTNILAAGTDIAVSALSSIQFVPDANTQGSPYSSFSFQVSDGANFSNVGTAGIFVRDISELPVTGSNTLPPFIAETTSNISANEQVATRLTSSISLVDDSGFIEGAKISLSGGGTAATTGEDELAAPVLPTGITATYDAATRTLTLTGRASLSDYQTALRNVTYTNTADFPQTAARTVSVTVNDGLQDSATQSYSLTVNDTADNLAPTRTQAAFTSSSQAPLFETTTVSVSEILTGIGADPQNVGDSLGIAIVGSADSEGGTWEYNTGAGWLAVGATSDGSALLLDSGASLRLVNPSTAIGTQATLDVRVWDRTSDNPGERVSTTVNGGTSAYSTDKSTIVVDVVAGTPFRLQAEDATVATLGAAYKTAPGGDAVQLNFGGSGAARTAKFSDTTRMNAQYSVTVGYYDEDASSPTSSLVVGGTTDSWSFNLNAPGVLQTRTLGSAVSIDWSSTPPTAIEFIGGRGSDDDSWHLDYLEFSAVGAFV